MTKNLLKTFLLILILSTIGISLWLYEILQLKGLDWIWNTLYSPFIGTLLAACSFIAAFIISGKITTKLIFSVIILYVINILCFLAGQDLCHNFESEINGSDSFFSKEVYLLLTKGFLLFPLHGLAHWFVINKLVKKNKLRNSLFTTLCMMLVVPLSLVSITIYNGLGTANGWIDAVKMGYPIFWTIFLMGISGIILAKQKNLIIKDKSS